MKTRQVPNSPYFICYDDDGFFCVSKDKDGKKTISAFETQAFLDAVANGLLYIEKERKSRYQRIDESQKAAFAKGEAEGKEDKLLATVKELKEEQALEEERERKWAYEAYLILRITAGQGQSGFAYQEIGE